MSPALAHILASANQFRAGSISAERLQREVSGAMSALEGDVPSAMRDAAFQLEAQIDSARFTVSEADLREHIVRLLDEFASLAATWEEFASPP